MLSMLMSVYGKDNPDHFQVALESIVKQTVLPSEIILIADGPLTDALDSIIEEFSKKLPIFCHRLSQNQGLAVALNYGLELATQPWIMRFDSDDYCHPDRVKEQIETIVSNQFDIFGSQIAEFEWDPIKPTYCRRVPSSHEQICKFARKRNPFNHMTVCYKRSLAIESGGYPLIPLMEDYALWALMLARDARAYNSPSILVHARVGNGMTKRRGGLKYVRSEIALQKHLHIVSSKNLLHCLCDGIARSFVFLSPDLLRKIVYRLILRRKL